MKLIANKVKITIKYAIRSIAWQIFSLFPIDEKKVVISSFNGRGFSDNPKYIAVELIHRRPDLKLYWSINSEVESKTLPSYIIPIRHNKLAHIYHLRTAKLWIDNCRKPAHTKKRVGQLYIQTWHGNTVIIKNIEADAQDKLSSAYIKSAKNDSNMCDLIPSGSEFFTKILKNSFWYSGEIIKCGTPRNDIFFSDNSNITRIVKTNLGIPSEVRIVLYAPTFRSNIDNNEAHNLDYELLLDSLEKRFGGKWVVVVRLHPNEAIKSKEILKGINAIDASFYPDMQELLVASDCVVSDYSSSVFEFLITHRPIFIFATDIENYKKERGIYINFRKLPFEISTSNKQLSKNIFNFNQRAYSSAIESFKAAMGYYENGKASKVMADWILQYM